MNRYLFSYSIKSTGDSGEFSQIAQSEEEAKQLIVERVADIEFTDTEDVVIGELIKTINASTQYYECEGCT